jgi:hypothetical protein
MDDGTLAEGPPKTQEQCRIKVSSVFCFFLERQVCSLSVLEGFIIILLLVGRAAGFSQLQCNVSCCCCWMFAPLSEDDVHVYLLLLGLGIIVLLPKSLCSFSENYPCWCVG